MISDQIIKYLSKMEALTSTIRRVGVVQLCSSSNVQANILKISSFAERARAQGAQLVCFPENFNYIGSMGTARQYAQHLNGEYMNTYSQIARTNNIWLSLGGFQELCSTNEAKYHNTHVIINNQGEVVAAYRKLHLFDVNVDKEYSESRIVEKGSEIVPPVSSPVGKLGLSICYDIRFPELYRRLADLGAEVLLVPAAFLEKTGYAHWEALLRARAIENGCYVIASAQEGRHDSGRFTYGHSCVIDPWGSMISQASEGEHLLTVDIDLNYLKQVREKVPSLNHIRKDVFTI